jgi:putative membrane protein
MIASRRVWLRRVGTVLVAGGLLAGALVAVGVMVAWSGAAGVGRVVWRGLPALPAALVVHGVQLGLSGLAWRYMVRPPAPSVGIVMRARWVREALNTAIPLAGLGGAVGSTRLLARQSGISMASATASLTGDLTVEASAQAPFLIAALATVAILAPGRLTVSRMALAILPVALGAAGFVLAQRAGMMRLVEHAARRLGFGDAMAGLHDGLMALHARPGAVLRAFGLHLASWSLGGAEVFVILHAIGVPVGPGAAFAIEGLGMAARSLGFALPAGLAAQEAGFVLACSIFGIGAQEGLALSMVKRLREVAVAASGLVVWRWWPGGRH